MADIKIGRRFLVYRKEDVSGISGTGYVAEGIKFHDGQVVISWFGKQRIFECPQGMRTWLNVHGHNGRTTIKWIDSTSTISLPEPKSG